MGSSADALMVELARRARSLFREDERAVLGITGAPGSGKSTVAAALAQRLRADDPGGDGRDPVAQVPMDGFHLADAELARLGILGSKGAPDTFDVGGYVALLERLHTERERVVYAPSFDRSFEQPIAGSIAVAPSARLVVTEGNYLLADGEWARVRPLLTETWFVEVAEAERLRRLVARHEEFGKPADEAWEWAHGVDQRNAELVAGFRDRGDLIVHVDAGRIEEIG